MDNISEKDIIRRLVSRFKARIESRTNTECIINELAASLFGDNVVEGT